MLVAKPMVPCPKSSAPGSITALEQVILLSRFMQSRQASTLAFSHMEVKFYLIRNQKG